MTPLHFAAASGRPLSPFTRIWDKYRDDQDVPADDVQPQGERVNGEEETSGEKKKSRSRRSIDDKDIDGWTPLMWAAKTCINYTDSIRDLCERGANLWKRGHVLDVRTGNDMMWSPLKVLRYNGATEDVYKALTPSKKTRRVLPKGRIARWNDDEHKRREAVRRQSTCSHCLTCISGLDYVCRVCDFHLCYKCVRQKAILHDPEHGFTTTDGMEYDPDEDDELGQLSEDSSESEDDFDEDSDEEG
ncbi:hypothetical protein ACQKWADRAFT_276939 [Trichoderma austrokoningii]